MHLLDQPTQRPVEQRPPGMRIPNAHVRIDSVARSFHGPPALVNLICTRERPAWVRSDISAIGNLLASEILQQTVRAQQFK